MSLSCNAPHVQACNLWQIVASQTRFQGKFQWHQMIVYCCVNEQKTAGSSAAVSGSNTANGDDILQVLIDIN